MALGHRASALAVLGGAVLLSRVWYQTSRSSSTSTSSGMPRVTGPWYIATRTLERRPYRPRGPPPSAGV